MKLKPVVPFLMAALSYFSQASLAAAAPASPAPVLEIHAKGVLAAGIVQKVADISGQDMVMYGVPDGTRIDLSGEFASADVFFRHVASQLGLTAEKIDGVTVLTRPCANNTLQRYPFLPPEPLSLNFQRVSLNATFEVFSDFYANPLDTQAVDSLPLGRMAVRMKDQPGERVLSAMLMAAGLRLAQAPGERWRVEKKPEANGCDRFPGNRSDDPSFEPSPSSPVVAKLHPLTGEKGDIERRRQPLEAYELQRINLRGHLRAAGKTLGLIETDDGLLWPLSVGDYLGPDFGLVQEILPNRIRIREIRQNIFDMWDEQTVELTSGMPVRSVGATRYEEAITELRRFVHFSNELSRACAAEASESSRRHAATIRRWLDSNANEVAEVDAHLRAFAERQAASDDDPNPSDFVIKAFVWHVDSKIATVTTELRQSTEQHWRRATDGPQDTRRGICKSFTQSLAGKPFGKRFASEFATLRRCQAQGHCANLEKFSRGAIR